jgi:hypothetical protein
MSGKINSGKGGTVWNGLSKLNMNDSTPSELPDCTLAQVP